MNVKGLQIIRNINMVTVLSGSVLLFFIWGWLCYPVQGERRVEFDNSIKETARYNDGPKSEQAQNRESLAIQDQRMMEGKKNEEQLVVVEYAREQEPSRGAQRGLQVTLESTGYTCGPESTGKHPSASDYCQTASGYRLQPGDKVVAMGKKYPFGTLIMIPGYGLATVRDRGGAVGDNHIDLYFERNEDALKWGRRAVTVTVL